MRWTIYEAINYPNFEYINNCMFLLTHLYIEFINRLLEIILHAKATPLSEDKTPALINRVMFLDLPVPDVVM